MKFLTRRPGEGTTPEEVHVEVEDGLACVGAVVEDEAVAAGGNAFGLGQLLGGGEKGGKGWGVFGDDGATACDVSVGDDEDVGRGLGVTIPKGGDGVVFEDDFGGEVAVYDFAKETVGHEDSFLSLASTGQGEAFAYET
jgi:hypothetical protein